MDHSRQQIVQALRHAGMHDLADLAEKTLPDPVDSESADEFCAAHGISIGSLMDRMGGSP